MPLSPLIASFSRKLLEDYTSPPPVTNDNSYNYNINPRFSTVLAVASFALVGVFFCACFCSIYLRRCSSNLDNIDQPASTHRHYRAGLGVEPDLVQTFPLVIYSVDVKESSPTNYDSECVVCLSEFEEGETLRLLPECKHGFHRDCIDMWLFSHTTCPLCRSSVLNKASADSVVPIEPRIPTIGERMNEEAEDLTATLLHQADNTATQSDQQRCDLGVDNNQLRRSHSTGQLIISTQSDRLADTVCGKNTEAASSRPQRVSSMDRVCYRVQEEGTSKKKTAAAANSTSLWRSAGMSLSRSFRLPKLSSSSSFSAQTSESVTSAV